MGRRAGVGGGQAAEARDIAGQLNDALVVDVVQHVIEVFRLRPIGLGGRASPSYIGSQAVEIQSSLYPQASGGEPPRLPVTLRSETTGRTELTWTP